MKLQKSNNGVTLITLVVTLTVIAILVTTIGYNVLNRSTMTQLDELYSDLTLLEQRYKAYYSEHGTVPFEEKVEDVEYVIAILGEQRNEDDNDEYYYVGETYIKGIHKINYSALGEVNLNNKGQFIVNAKTLTVYYLDGLKLEGNIYYTLPRYDIDSNAYDLVDVPIRQIILEDQVLIKTEGILPNLTITPKIYPINATNQNLTWESSNTDVVEVDSIGVITYVGVGHATITCYATDGSEVKATCQVTCLAELELKVNGWGQGDSEKKTKEVIIDVTKYSTLQFDIYRYSAYANHIENYVYLISRHHDSF